MRLEMRPPRGGHTRNDHHPPPLSHPGRRRRSARARSARGARAVLRYEPHRPLHPDKERRGAGLEKPFKYAAPPGLTPTPSSFGTMAADLGVRDSLWVDRKLSLLPGPFDIPGRFQLCVNKWCVWGVFSSHHYLYAIPNKYTQPRRGC